MTHRPIQTRVLREAWSRGFPAVTPMASSPLQSRGAAWPQMQQPLCVHRTQQRPSQWRAEGDGGGTVSIWPSAPAKPGQIYNVWELWIQLGNILQVGQAAGGFRCPLGPRSPGAGARLQPRAPGPGHHRVGPLPGCRAQAGGRCCGDAGRAAGAGTPGGGGAARSAGSGAERRAAGLAWRGPASAACAAWRGAGTSWTAPTWRCRSPCTATRTSRARSRARGAPRRAGARQPLAPGTLAGTCRSLSTSAISACGRRPRGREMRRRVVAGPSPPRPPRGASTCCPSATRTRLHRRPRRTGIPGLTQGDASNSGSVVGGN